MRIRSIPNTSSTVVEKNDVHLGEGYPWPYGPSWPYPGENPVTFSRYSETMVDVEHGYGRENPCYHEKTVTELLPNGSAPIRVDYKDSNGEWKLGYEGSIGSMNRQYYTSTWLGSLLPVGSAMHPGPLVGPNESVANWGIPDYSSDALEAMWPQVKTEMSLVNSIYELKDFKRLPSLLKQSHDTFDKLSNFLTGLAKSHQSKSKTLRDLVGVGTGHYLNYMFAVAPLIRDMRSAVKAIRSAREGLKRLRAGMGKIHISHYRKSLDADLVGVETINEDDAVLQYSGYYCSHKAVRFVDSGWYTATMRYSFQIPDDIGRFAGLLAQLDAFGVNLDPAIIWNAIPFSFVVDWFARVGNELHKLRVRAMPLIVQIHGFSHSVRYNVKSEVRNFPLQSNRAYWATQNPQTVRCSVVMDGQIMARVTRSVFIRKPATPTLIRTPDWDGFSTTEKWLSGALVASFAAGYRPPVVDH